MRKGKGWQITEVTENQVLESRIKSGFAPACALRASDGNPRNAVACCETVLWREYLLAEPSDMPLSDFRYIDRFRVPYCDVDMLQHANHASYVVWAETARCGYFVEVLKEPITGPGGMILARLEFDYEEPLDFNEQVAIGCGISRIGHKSFDFLYEIWSETRQLRAARGVSTMVAYDYRAKQSVAVPERWVKAITNYELVAPKR